MALISPFDQIHVNLGIDGTPINSIMQLLCGSGHSVHQRLPSGENVKVYFSCPSPEAGWLHSVDGLIPFNAIGTKTIIQVVGPSRWKMEYIE